jgi:hypothetical protein
VRRFALEMIVGGYALAYAAGMITAGRLGDMLGHRRMFMTAERQARRLPAHRIQPANRYQVVLAAATPRGSTPGDHRHGRCVDPGQPQQSA